MPYMPDEVVGTQVEVLEPGALVEAPGDVSRKGIFGNIEADQIATQRREIVADAAAEPVVREVEGDQIGEGGEVESPLDEVVREVEVGEAAASAEVGGDGATDGVRRKVEVGELSEKREVREDAAGDVGLSEVDADYTLCKVAGDANPLARRGIGLVPASVGALAYAILG